MRPGRAAAAVTVALALAGTLAPVTAAHAQPAPGAGGAAGAADTAAAEAGSSIAGFIGRLVGRLDAAGAFENATGGDRGAVSRHTHSQTWTATVARPDQAGQLTATEACLWELSTRLEASYEKAGALQAVAGTPRATLSCDGAFGLPVRQDGTLRHSHDGGTPTTVTTESCRNTDPGCRATSVGGGVECSGPACAGTHRFSLEHTWTLPSPYVWQHRPSHCSVSDGGSTLRCESRGETVAVSSTAGIGVRAAPDA